MKSTNPTCTTELFIDLETYSSVELSTSGVYRYAESEDFEILLFAYSYNSGPVEVIDLTEQTLPQKIIEDILNPAVLKKAHNAAFERVCLSAHLRTFHKGFSGPYLSPEGWYCTAVHASMCGLPSKLEKLGEALGLSEDKKKLSTGKSLINYFCKPCRPTKVNGGRTRNFPYHKPDAWTQFIEYNRRDVETEIEIEKILLSIIPISQQEQKRYWLDQLINDKGLKIDLDLVDTIVTFSQKRNQDLRQEALERTGVNVQSPEQIKAWLKQATGEEFKTIGQEALSDIIQQYDAPELRQLLEYRQEIGRTSCTKYKTFQRITCKDGRVHGCLQFYGSRTGRWAGRLVQPHNLPAGRLSDLDEARSLVKDREWELLEMCYPSVNEVFSSLIRTVIVPGKGKAFAVADFSAIEARVIAWLADEEWRLKAFHDGEDIYCASASSMFGVPVEKHGQNAALRKKGKVAELACGYQGGIGALKKFGADKMGLSEDEMDRIVSLWRERSPRICALWRTLEDRAHVALNLSGSDKIPVEGPRGTIFEHRQGDLKIKLPSGRSLIYRGFGIREEPKKGKDSLSFMGIDQHTHKWGVVYTYGGKLTENVVQAIARDCLACAVDALEAAGWRPVLHVHDEVIIEVPEDRKEECLKEIEQIMCRPIEWAPGLELKAAGFTAAYYQKD